MRQGVLVVCDVALKKSVALTIWSVANEGTPAAQRGFGKSDFDFDFADSEIRLVDLDLTF